MQELIDKHAAYMALKHEAETHGLSFSGEAYDRAARIIDQMQTIKPEVRHGRWIKQENGSNLCSVCGVTKVSHLPFCGHCGADMREGGAENG